MRGGFFVKMPYNVRDIKEKEGVTMAKVTFRDDLCKGCGLCVNACPKKILELDKSRLNNKGYHPVTCIDQDQCIGCTFCAVQCPDSVITVER